MSFKCNLRFFLKSVFLTVSLSSISSLSASASSADIKKTVSSPWWKEAIFYEIYIRSFNDSDGDGVGDLNGITNKLDYLKSLGVDAVLLTPHYASPNIDSGYDVSDYRNVMKEYGSLSDFDRLIAEMKKRDMRLMIDIVVNHTSDQHPWFVESSKSKDNYYRDFYIWREGKEEAPPTTDKSSFGGSMWELSRKTGQYYFHTFSKHQPDLNWCNENVKQAVYRDIKFWLDKGVAGLRFDAIADFVKPYDTVDQFRKYKSETVEKVVDPKVHAYVKELNKKVFSGRDIATAAEVWRTPSEEVSLFTDPKRKELNFAFIFDAIFVGRKSVWEAKPWSLIDLKSAIGHVDKITGKNGWSAFFLTNHDNARQISHFGNDTPEWRNVSAKALATLNLTQRATPFIYQGDEIGMTNSSFPDINSFDDVQLKGYWTDLVDTRKVDAEYFMKNARMTNRDNSRTPFQWSPEHNAGFSTGTPWFKVNDNYKEINVSSQIDDPKSVYNYYKSLIAIRKSSPALIHGKYRDLDPGNVKVYAYTRSLKDEKYLVLINMSESNVRYLIPKNIKLKKIIIQNLDNPDFSESHVSLKPWQASIYKI
ncbi:glycoside hydrolase family 13 protein [Serratia nevei]|uniref:glycoside hydrolase family 13 protein n=1 Tax=Serratia nevei TaxID=2703794 RepID=UPI0036BDFBFE